MTPHHDHSLISQKTTGVFLVVGLAVIFFLHTILLLPFATTLGLVTALFLGTIFLHRPLEGFLALIVLRASVDFMDTYFSLRITENFSLNIASLLALMLITMCLVLIIANYRKFTHIPLLWSFGTFILCAGISATYSIDRPETLQETVRIISIFATFLMSYFFCITHPHARTTIISTVLFASFLPIMLAFYQLISGTGFSDNTGTDGRLFGTFKHPNSFASFLMIIIALLTYRAFDQDNTHTERHTKTAFLLIVIGLLILTFSRGGWLALLIFFGIFSLLRAPKILFFGMIIGVSLFFISPVVHDRIEDIYNPPADSSIRWRFQQWQNAIAAWKLSPIYGYGAGTEIAIPEKEQGFYAGNPYTHNDLIKVLQELGMIGVIVFSILIITTIIRLFLTYRHTKNVKEKTFALIVLLLFLAEIGFGMSSNIWRGTAVQWLLWLLVACALSLHTHDKKIKAA